MVKWNRRIALLLALPSLAMTEVASAQTPAPKATPHDVSTTVAKDPKVMSTKKCGDPAADSITAKFMKRSTPTLCVVEITGIVKNVGNAGFSIGSVPPMVFLDVISNNNVPPRRILSKGLRAMKAGEVIRFPVKTSWDCPPGDVTHPTKVVLTIQTGPDNPILECTSKNNETSLEASKIDALVH
jgi:hypothetical protein